MGWIWGLPLLVFSCLSSFLTHRGLCLRWNSLIVWGGFESWDRGLACSFTHLSKQCRETKRTISARDSWWNHFVPATIPWSNFNDLSWALNFSGLRFGGREREREKVQRSQGRHKVPTKLLGSARLYNGKAWKKCDDVFPAERRRKKREGNVRKEGKGEERYLGNE